MRCMKLAPMDPDRIRDIVTKIRGEETSMRSLLDLLMEMGEERGKQQAVQQGMQAMFAVVLESHFGELSPAMRARLAAADEATLRRWNLRVLAARCVEDVFVD